MREDNCIHGNRPCDGETCHDCELDKMAAQYEKELKLKNERITALESQAAENKKLKEFLDWLFGEVFEGSPDGGDIQDKAEEMGILIQTKIPPEKMEEYSHHDFIDIDEPFLLFPYWSEELKALSKPQSEGL